MNDESTKNYLLDVLVNGLIIDVPEEEMLEFCRGMVLFINTLENGYSAVGDEDGILVGDDGSDPVSLPPKKIIVSKFVKLPIPGGITPVTVGVRTM